MRVSTILAASGLAFQSAMAFKAFGVDIPETPEGLVLVDMIQNPEKGQNGVITIYEDAEPADVAARALENSDLEKRCGSNQVNCHSSNRADANTCRDLLNFIRYQSPNTKVSNSPRSVCQTNITNGGTKRCCTSWAANVDSAIWHNLSGGVDDALKKCSGDVSARVHDAKIGKTCTIQCVSNRPDGC